MNVRSLSTLALSMLLTGASYAQIATTMSLVGTVTDSTGQSVASAKVTAVETGTFDTHVTTTNDQGYYSIEFIRLGTYNITAEREGFQKVTKTGVVVEINQVVRADIALSVGAVNQSIAVEADAGVIKTDDASVSEIITTRNVAELPLNGPDPMQLATTTPGVIAEKTSSGQARERSRTACRSVASAS